MSIIIIIIIIISNSSSSSNNNIVSCAQLSELLPQTQPMHRECGTRLCTDNEGDILSHVNNSSN
jgi:hypothetical protein